MKKKEETIQVKTCRTDMCTMRYVRFGKGDKTLVILPGLSVQSVMQSAELIADAYAQMADAFTIYVFDRREDLPAAYSVKEMARDTIEVLHALQLSRIHLFGASQGGMLAMQIAIDVPMLVEKLSVGSSSACVSEKQFLLVEDWIRLAKEGKATELYLAFGEAVYPQTVFDGFRNLLIDAAATVTEDELRRFVILAEGMKGFDITGDLEKIDCPVLVLGDRTDRVLGVEASEQIGEALRGKKTCELYLYDGFGHAAYDTAPDYKERLLRFFL